MLIDEQRQLKMEITYTIFAGLGTIARNQRITNLGAEKTTFFVDERGTGIKKSAI